MEFQKAKVIMFSQFNLKVKPYLTGYCLYLLTCNISIKNACFFIYRMTSIK